MSTRVEIMALTESLWEISTAASRSHRVTSQVERIPSGQLLVSLQGVWGTPVLGPFAPQDFEAALRTAIEQLQRVAL